MVVGPERNFETLAHQSWNIRQQLVETDAFIGVRLSARLILRMSFVVYFGFPGAELGSAINPEWKDSAHIAFAGLLPAPGSS